MNKKLEDIIRYCQGMKHLISDLESETLSKTILLISKDADYAYIFGKLLSCFIFDGGDKGESENYLKVMAASHPDLKEYPLKDKLLVSDSEEIVFEATVKPVFAERKVFIIKNIEDSMEAAQNKLLKTLEEPERNVYFILTASNINLVLPTIRSRCNKIELGKLKNEEIGQLIAGSENLDLVTALSDGYIGKAERLSRIEDLKEKFESILSLITKLKTSKEMLGYSKAILDYDLSYEFVFEVMMLIYEDILFIKGGKGSKIRFKGYREVLEGVSKEYTVKAIIEVRGLIDKALREMSYNCNFVVVLENLLLNILEVKYLCR